MTYKPKGYNSVSPYYVVQGADKLIDLLVDVFDAKRLRRYDLPDGSIMHAEIKIDDSVLMFGESKEGHTTNKMDMHIYVENVDSVFQKAIDLGCQSIQEPVQKDGQPDRRGGFADFAGNSWWVSQQVTSE